MLLRVACIGLDWIGLDWIGLDWIELDWRGGYGDGYGYRYGNEYNCADEEERAAAKTYAYAGRREGG